MLYVPGKYKTREGAAKRAAFERSMNPNEFARGDVARLYTYGLEQQPDGTWRVTKTPKPKKD